MLIKGQPLPHYAFKGEGLFGTKVEDVDTTKNKVAWVGNTYNFLDSDNEVLMDGVCAESIKLRGPESNAVGKIKHFINHDADPRKMPGKIVELCEKEMTIKGMKVKCLFGVTEMNMKTQLGRETLAQYANGDLDQHSIGFQYLEVSFLERKHGNSKEGEEFKKLCDMLINPEEAEDKDYLVRVDAIKLFENSTVGFGANSMTPMVGIKGATKEAIKLVFNNQLTKYYDLLQESMTDSGVIREDWKSIVDIQYLQLKQISSELFSHVNFEEIIKGKVSKETLYSGLIEKFKSEKK